ncbi:uncharacterized protein LOC141696445 [Apium graveolens]|uniref:uncharacterized protein LOC141696445 n=1 Tax=Apium graveolens TaxID=4045 RepID=UPI003D7A1A57
MVNHRGIEANPAKIKALLGMKSPTSVKQVQSLTGRIAALNQFISKSSDRVVGESSDVGQARRGRNIDSLLGGFRILCQRGVDKGGSKPSMARVLREQKIAGCRNQIYQHGEIALNRFVSKSSDRCKEFFKAIKGMGKDFVWTSDCEEAFLKIKEQLGNPPMLANPEEGETLILYLAVSEYSVSAVLSLPRKEILLLMKGKFPHPWRNLHFDGAVNNNGAGAEIVLVTLEGHHLMSVIHFKFYVTNNDVEFEALINGLKIDLEVGVVNLIARSDSELVVNQVNGGFQARGPRTELYMNGVQRLLEKFGSARLEGVPREENSNANTLANMGLQMDSIQLGQISLGIQEIPSVPEIGVFQTLEIPRENWMIPIHNYIRTRALSEDKLQARRLRYQTAKYVEYDGILYKRGFNQPLLCCVDLEEGNYILTEVHEGICGNHSGVVHWH